MALEVHLHLLEGPMDLERSSVKLVEGDISRSFHMPFTEARYEFISDLTEELYTGMSCGRKGISFGVILAQKYVSVKTCVRTVKHLNPTLFMIITF